ncbi:MAG TPA: MlaD family protein [Longimicrobiales bacterium]|nr:MlaD family protein [Longimicrobiales bacterium]
MSRADRRQRRNDVRVGLAILAALAVAVFGTLWLKGGGFGREDRVLRAQFREVGQLVGGSRVKLRGVEIGRVDAIEFHPSGEYVVVSMRVDPDVPLPASPVMVASPESFFGDWQAEITERSRYPQSEFTVPAEQDILPGYALPDVGQLAGVADRIAENMAVLSDRVELAFTEETALRVRDAINNLQEVTQGLIDLVERQQGTVDELAADLSEMTETLGQTVSAINRVAIEVESALADGQTQAIVDNVANATQRVDSLTAALVAVSGDFGRTMASADTALVAISDLLTSVNAGEGTVGLLLQDTALYGRIVRSTELLELLLDDIRRNPRRYINLEIF